MVKTMRTSEVYLGLTAASASSRQEFKSLQAESDSDPIEMQLQLEVRGRGGAFPFFPIIFAKLAQ